MSACAWGETRGVKLAQHMRLGPCVLWAHSYKGLKVAEPLGRLGVFLTWAQAQWKTVPPLRSVNWSHPASAPRSSSSRTISVRRGRWSQHHSHARLFALHIESRIKYTRAHENAVHPRRTSVCPRRAAPKSAVPGPLASCIVASMSTPASSSRRTYG